MISEDQVFIFCDRHPVIALFGGFWLMFVGVLILAFPLVWVSSYMEASSYRKYCDTPVTTWDAMWLDLRIDECDGK